VLPFRPMRRSWFHALVGWLLASRDRSFAEFGEFAVLLKSLEPRVPVPLVLLSMRGDEVSGVLDGVEQAASRADPTAAIEAMFASPNWRPHLIAAVALLSDKGRQLDPSGLWRAVDAGSWVTPQLIATAYLIDPGFPERLRERIEAGCPIVVPPKLSAAARHTASGPASVEERSAKLLASLLRIGARVPSLASYLQGASRRQRVAALLAADRDQSGNIADNWLNNLTRQYQSRKGLPRPGALRRPG